jgi:hypothetical protein
MGAYTCECGSVIRTTYIQKHLQSYKHAVLLNGGTIEICYEMMMLRLHIKDLEEAIDRRKTKAEKRSLQKELDKLRSRYDPLANTYLNGNTEVPKKQAPKPKPPPPPPEDALLTPEELELKRAKQRKERKNEYGKKYYVEHRDELIAKRTEKVLCKCGMQISKGHLSEHLANNLHTRMLKEQNRMDTKATGVAQPDDNDDEDENIIEARKIMRGEI